MASRGPPASVPFRGKLWGIGDAPLRFMRPWKAAAAAGRLGVRGFGMGSLSVVLISARRVRSSIANCRGVSLHVRGDAAIRPGLCLSHREGAMVSDFKNVSSCSEVKAKSKI